MFHAGVQFHAAPPHLSCLRKRPGSFEGAAFDARLAVLEDSAGKRFQASTTAAFARPCIAGSVGLSGLDARFGTSKGASFTPPSFALAAGSLLGSSLAWSKGSKQTCKPARPHGTLPRATLDDEQTTTRSTLPQKSIFLVVFLHLLGFTMGSPILPSLRAHFQLDAAQTGLITSAFPVGMLFAVFVFPKLSDTKGRKPVLITSYLGVGIGFVLQALAIKFNMPFKVYLALRAVSGACAGATTVVKAYIADMSDRATLPRAMAYREAAATLSYIVGPTLGGFLFVLTDLPSVVLLSGLMSVFAAGWVSVFLRSPTPAAAKSTLEGSSPSGEVKGKRSRVAWLAMATVTSTHFLYYVGQAFLDAFFSVVCAERFGFDARVLGLMITLVACLVFFISTTVYSRIVQRFGVVRTAIVGLLSVAAGFLVLTVPWTLWAVAASMLFYGIGVPLFTPSVPTILAQCAPRDRRGFVLGIDSFVCLIARIASPALLGMLYKRSLEITFGWAGLAVLAGAGLMGMQQRRLRKVLD